MAKRKDMSKFDEDQIVMASFTDVLGQIICKTALQWSVSIKSDPVKVTVLNQQQGHGLLWLTDTCREQRLAHMVRSNRQTTVAQIAKNVDADSDRKVSEYTVHHYWLCMGLLTSRGAHADLSTTESTDNGHMSVRTGWIGSGMV